MMEGVTLLVLLAAASLWMVVAHGRLIKAKNEVYDSWAAVEDVLERRDQLIAVLGGLAQGRMGRDERSGVLVARLVQRCREAYGAEAVAQAEDALAAEVADLLHVVALSPGLIADPEAADLPGRIARLGAKVDEVVQVYNDAARRLNVLVVAFPSSMVAKMYGFRRVGYYEPQGASAPQRGEWV
ncbi:MAG: LemA family protein [Proteobacteria bacterium]|nr:LemA family protein [Pseudomonadota bacterium]